MDSNIKKTQNKKDELLYELLGDKRIVEGDDAASDLFAEACHIAALNMVQVKKRMPKG